ncbi:MAG: hypothetical protein ABFC57_17405 [Veillonellales bacterium]
MLSLTSVGLIEKNKLANDKPWLLLFQILLQTGEYIHIVRDNEDHDWNGIHWEAFPLEPDDKTEDTKALPLFKVKVANADQVMQSYLEQYDGLTGCEVTIYLVHAAHLDQTTPEIEEVFTIQESEYDHEWVTFSLGADFWYLYRALPENYLKDWCWHKYGGIKCGVNATCLAQYPTCPHTLVGCRLRMTASGIMKIRFSGEPSLPGGIYASN